MEKIKKKRRSGKYAKGSVSIMLAFLMLPMYTFAGAVADGARASAADQMASGAADLAANAALASYDDVLKSVYGLFAMSQTEEELTQNLYDYFNETVSCLPLGGDEQTSSMLSAAASYIGLGNTDYMDLIGLQADYFSAEPVEEAVIADPAVMKNQIVEYMKYLGPVSLGKSFLAKAGVFSDFKKHNKAVEAKVKYEENLSDIQELCEKAYSSICSYNSYIENCGLKNTAAVSADIDTVCRQYRAAALYIAQYSASSLAADDFPEDRMLEKNVRDSASNAQREIIDEISLRLQNYMPYTTNQDGSISEGSSDFLNMIKDCESVSSNQVRYAYLVHCAVWSEYGEVSDLMQLYEKYFSRLSSSEKDSRKEESSYFRKYNDIICSQRDTSSGLSDGWQENADNEISVAESLISSRTAEASVIAGYLDDAADTLDEIKKKLADADKDAAEWNSAIADISDGDVKTNMQSDYENTACSVNTAEIDKLRDAILKNKDIAEQFSDYLSGFSLGTCDQDYMITDSQSASDAADDYFGRCFQRPSGNIPSGFSQTGQGYDFYEYLSGICGKPKQQSQDSESVMTDLNSAGSQSEISSPPQNIPGIGEHMTQDSLDSILAYSSGGTTDSFSMDDSSSSDTKDMLDGQKKSLSGASSMFSAIADIASAAAAEGRDDLYLTEYITEMFSCRTSDKVCSGNTVKDFEPYTLSGIKMNDKNNVFYKNEVEYILWGDPDMEKNLQNTSAMLFGIRFLLNNIYAFTDREINTSATTVATAIAGWSGFGVPIVRTVIIMSLALAESVIDVNELLDGKNVVIYKSSSTWNMKPSGLINALKNNSGQIAQMAADKAGKKVSDVFEKIEEISADKTDELTDALHGMVGDVADEAASAAENAVMGPIDDAVEHILESTDEIFSKESITDLVEQKLDLVCSGGDDITSVVSGYMKDLVLEKTEDISDIIYQGYTQAAGQGQDAVEKIRESVSDQIENIIEPIRKQADDYIDEISDDLKEQITNGINAAGDNAKEYASEMASKLVTGAADAVSSKIPGGSSSVSLSGNDKTSAGKTLTLNYREYLKLFIMLNTFSDSKEEQMLSRMAVLMQVNLTEGMNDTGDSLRGSKNSNFDITKAYTMIRIDADVKMNMWFTGVFVPDSSSSSGGNTTYSLDYSLFGTDEKNISVHSIMSY